MRLRLLMGVYPNSSMERLVISLPSPHLRGSFCFLMNDHSADTSSLRRFLLYFTGVASVAALGLGGWWCFLAGPTGEHLTHRARTALARGEYALAEQLALRVPRDNPLWARAQLISGEAAFRAGRTSDAIRRYASVARDGSLTSVRAALSQAELCRDIGQLSAAEREYRYVLKHDPSNAAAHDRLAFLLGVTGRRWESLPHFMYLVRTGNWTLDTLALVGDLERPLEQIQYLRQCAETTPDDLLVQQGLAAHAFAEGHSSEARQLLGEIVAESRGRSAAQAMLGELLVDADDETFLKWHSGLTTAADDYPDMWYVRGLWARRHGELRVAARCFWETVRRAPTHRRGHYQLGQVLSSLGETSGQEYGARSRELFELTRALDDALRSQGRHEPILKKISELLEGMGRAWEAWAWAALASRTFPDSAWAGNAIARLELLLRNDTPQVLDSANLALAHDLSRFPDHTVLVRGIQDGKKRATERVTGSLIRFDESLHAGIDFTYDNSSDAETPGARTFEQNGGGVGILDYDADGWPDLYFTQGAPWSSGASAPSTSPDLIDRLYRNLAGRRFVDVTRSSGMSDMRFGQGCTVGDFDSDGLPDLYVANVGRNALYRNNGDGTFAEVTAQAGIEQAEWTASCAMMDLNGDGLADLFDVNYLAGPQLYELICDGKACSPKVFDGAPDCLLINRGDGSFEAVPGPIGEANGKGLGVVAAVVQSGERPSLFIANDQVPNSFLRSTSADGRNGVDLQDEGFASGLAFNEDGLAMACMGIAADDADGNGLIDFFVTNFKDESNTLYRQDAPGLFTDATNPAGLRAPSWPFVGWGTQFLDADLDGNPDLVVANGHVDDYRDEGGEYHMRPQFYRNAGGGRFVELLADEAGSYFGRKYLGRGLARLDWNRDGRMDFVVSNIGERAALVTNESSNVGHFLNVRLHATQTARDAIGTTVEVATEERRWTKQLVAGDGYMASNERVLQFGLGTATSVKEVHIRWPSGESTRLENLPSDITIQLVEGSPRVIQWGGPRRDSPPLH